MNTTEIMLFLAGLTVSGFLGYILGTQRRQIDLHNFGMSIRNGALLDISDMCNKLISECKTKNTSASEALIALRNGLREYVNTENAP